MFRESCRGLAHAYCGHKLGGGREPFAAPDAPSHFPADRPARMEHLHLILAVDLAAKAVEATAITRFRVLALEVDELALDAVAFEIAEVSWRGYAEHTCAIRYDGRQLRVRLSPPLAPGEVGELTVRYTVKNPLLGLYFIGPTPFEPERRMQVWSQNQDEDARYWIPCYDSPNSKATFELEATVSEPNIVLSNGALLSVVHPEPGRRTFRWRLATPHSPYLVTLVAGEFEGRSEEVGELPLSWYVAPGRLQDGARAFDPTARMVSFFSDYFHHPYPYEKYAQVAVSDFVFGGMENTSMTTVTERALPDERGALVYSSQELIAHELAHQWFGDLVTCRQWAHAWLNEGFATYCEILYREHAQGPAEALLLLQRHGESYMDEDSERYRRPVVCNQYEEPIDLFDGHLYEKGAWVLHMLRHELGDDAFRGSVSHYLRKHAFGHVETTDLMRAIEEHTGRSLDAFFDQWLLRTGYPELSVSMEWEPAKSSAVVVVEQTQAAEHGTPLVFRFSVTMDFLLGNGALVSRRVEVNARRASFSFDLPDEPVRFRFDVGSAVLKTVKLTVAEPLLIEQLNTDDNPLGCLQAAAALAAMPHPRAVDALVAASVYAPSWGVRAGVAPLLAKIGSDGCVQALEAMLGDDNAKVRKAALAALGQLGRPALGDVAKRVLESAEPSIHVLAEAAVLLGKSRPSWAKDYLATLLPIAESWNDVLRVGVLDGIRELDDPSLADLCVEWTRDHRSEACRRAAAKALGRLGVRSSLAIQVLGELASTAPFLVKLSALDALAELGDPKGLGAIAKVLALPGDGRVRNHARAAQRAIERSSGLSARERSLQEDVMGLRNDNRALRERVERLEWLVNKAP